VKDNHLPSKRCPFLIKAIETLRKCSRVWNSVFEFHTCFLLLRPKLNQHLIVLTPTFKPQGSSLPHNRLTDRVWLISLLICYSLDMCACVCNIYIGLYLFTNGVKIGIKGPWSNCNREQSTSFLSNIQSLGEAQMPKSRIHAFIFIPKLNQHEPVA
jgi:hypothetical protein